MWILGSFKLDLLFLMLPGFISIAIAVFIPNLGEASLIYGLLATALIDSGHVYTTFWRTFLHHGQTSLRTFLIPLSFLVLFSSWYYLRFPGLWSFVVYSTLFHHLRQLYGFSKWYQTLNQRMDKLSDRFLYGFALLPLFIYHFRPDAIGSYYSENDLFLFPNSNVRDALMGAYGVVVIFWMSFEINLWRNGFKEVNRLISVAYPTIVYGYCFLLGQTVTQILFPLLFVHGIAYFGVMGQTLHRTHKSYFKSRLVGLMLIITTAAIFGLTESWVEEEAVDLYSGNPLWLNSFLVGLTLTPLYCHYFYDALIWKKSHPEAHLVYGKETPPSA